MFQNRLIHKHDIIIDFNFFFIVSFDTLGQYILSTYLYVMNTIKRNFYFAFFSFFESFY